MCTEFTHHPTPRMESNSRGDTMRTPATVPRTRRSRSPEIRYSHPALVASPRIKSSSGSRHNGRGWVFSTMGLVRRSTNFASRCARLGEYRNFFTNFSSTSRKIGRPEKTSHCFAIRLHSCRQNPRRAVRTDNQTLLSSRTRIRRDHARKRQDLFLSHLHISGQAVRPCKKRVVVLIDEPINNLRPVVGGHLLEFFDYLICGHVCRLAATPCFSSFLSR